MISPKYEPREIGNMLDTPWGVFDTFAQKPVEYEGPWPSKAQAITACARLNRAYLRATEP